MSTKIEALLPLPEEGKGDWVANKFLVLKQNNVTLALEGERKEHSTLVSINLRVPIPGGWPFHGNRSFVLAEAPKSQNPVDSPCPKRGGISPGTGGGIGAAAGILVTLATMVAIYFLYGRKRRPSPPHSFNKPFPSTDQKPSSQPLTTAPSVPADEADLFRALHGLDSPLPTSALEGDIKLLRREIDHCVNNYLYPETVRLSDADENALRHLAGQPRGWVSWSTALNSRLKRPLATKMLLAKILFAKIQPASGSQGLFLPFHLSQVYRVLSTRPQRGRRHSVAREQTERSTLLSLWRRISGHLHPDDLQAPDVTDITSALAPLQSGDQGNFGKIVQDLAKLTTKLGMKLFVQPREWRLVWDEGQQQHGDRSRYVAVFPGVAFVQQQQGQHGDSDPGPCLEVVSEPVFEGYE